MTNHIKMTEEQFDKFDPIAKMVKDSPCNFCGRKSIARMRKIINNKLWLLAVCKDHIYKLETAIKEISTTEEK